MTQALRRASGRNLLELSIHKQVGMETTATFPPTPPSSFPPFHTFPPSFLLSLPSSLPHSPPPPSLPSPSQPPPLQPSFLPPPPPFSVAPCLQTNMQPGMNGVLMGCAGLLLIKRCATSLFCLYKTSAPVRVSTAFCGFCLGGEERGVCSTNAEAASYSGKR